MKTVAIVSQKGGSRKTTIAVHLATAAAAILRQLALDTETTTQALGEEAINLLFAKHGLNRSA